MNDNKIKLYMLQTGTIKCKENNIKMNADPNPYEIPIPWFLITHPKGNVIIDGGTSVECATDPKAHWGGITDVYWPVMTEEEGCYNAVQALGIDPESIKFVLQSHLHLDHTGAIGRFPNATHVVQRKEYEYAYSADWFASGGYIKKDFDQPNLKWHFLSLENDDQFDLYGDGSIIMIPTPGHSPGHCSFLITLPNQGSILLAIDAAYTTEHWDDKVLPGFLTSAIESARSVAKLRFIAQQTEALVVTGHDPDTWDSFRKAPKYYD
ncbi:N-acyl homoserine lactonase family protein [Ignatzschineria indica]|uniref:AttM family quorum-quenching N-acyl homoserine lactonase n=1 Tax=Ignatzschineria indica TaxID=472583 RepID=UPI002576C55A|nr:N-acyl homoserine lactonase family protein [Ignatzschineria indica]MDM1545300.1 N-acyl homoserine lactonase family protein [Ignatzschineria indica]